ncbi:MAG: leucyl aminopeptidase [candidate division WOR-3 bacterium]
MKIELISKSKWSGKTYAALMFEGENKPLGMDKEKGRKLTQIATEERFQGELRRTALLRSQEGEERIILTGLGKRKDFEPDRVRIAVAKAVKRAEEIGAKSLGILLPEDKEIRGDALGFVAGIVEGGVLAAYRDLRFRKLRPDEPEPLEEMVIVSQNPPSATMRKAAEEARLRSEAVCYVRDLVNEPSQNKAPMRMAERAEELVVPGRITLKVMDKAELEKQGMGGILGVGRGSHNPPCMVQLTYTPKGRSKGTLVFVGKGITFDSGGLSLKTAQQMENMKDDMSGAGVVFGLFKYLRDVDLPYTIIGLAPFAENLPGGGAQKPGDVIRHFNGKTVEVMNTDAEGRLLLADALAYGATLKPDLMVDIATLTGACVVALGNECSGVLGTDQKTIERLINLGKEQGELFWQLPLIERYRSHMKSEVADLKNIGKPMNAGTIIGGLFLSEFVPKEINWVHIDIAGTAFTSEPRDYCPVGATGVPLRTLIAFLVSR